MMIKTHSQITEGGWIFYDKCKCGGKLKYIYRNPIHPGIEIEWWVKMNIFKAKEKGKTIIPPTRINLFTQSTKEL